jgi:hypothetical protein
LQHRRRNTAHSAVKRTIALKAEIGRGFVLATRVFSPTPPDLRFLPEIEARCAINDDLVQRKLALLCISEFRPSGWDILESISISENCVRFQRKIAQNWPTHYAPCQYVGQALLDRRISRARF